MIQVDDAGIGLPVGGVLIGACRVETSQFEWEEVPPESFQGQAWEDKDYLEDAITAAKNILDRLQAPPNEPITVCPGFVLSGVRSWLWRAFSDVTVGKIGAPLQGLIEHALQANLQDRYGFKIDFDVLTQKPGLAFFQSLVWLKGGNPYKVAAALPEREEWCKTGWASWSCWADHLYPEAKQLAAALKEERRRQRQFGSRQSGDDDPNAGLPF